MSARVLCSKIKPALLGAIPLFLFSCAAHSQTTASFDTRSSIFHVQYETALVLKTSFVFWRGQWSWLDLRMSSTALEKGRRYSFKGRLSDDTFALDGLLESKKENTATFHIQLSEGVGGAHDIYGGIAFRFSLDAIRRPGFDPRPRIFKNKMGWSLELEPGRPPLKVTFDKPVFELNYEPGDGGEIRATLLSRNDKRDMSDVKMTVTFPGLFQPSPHENLAGKNRNWRGNDVYWNRSPIDLSSLNDKEKPAGKHGFLKVKGEDLVFEDGTKARFWGTNLTSYALYQYTSKQTVRQQARRLSKLGFNLVRLHHHDSLWVTPNIFKKSANTTRVIDETSLDRLHWWIKCLKDEGIYVWIDLHVGREVSANDGIKAFDEIAKGKLRANIHGFSYVNPSIQERMKEFAKQYLSKVNRHTGLSLKDDPGVIAVLVTNENDLTHHFGNSLLPDKDVPWHNKRYMALAKEFASKTGLSYDKTWRSWEYGESKLFLSDVEHSFFKDMTAFLRKLGVKVPVIGTSFWGHMSLAGLPSLAAGDMIDVHAYGRANEVMSNPRYRPNLASWIASGAIAGKPLTVSEWNVEPFPVFDRHAMPAHLSAIACLQSWDALMLYAYAQGPMTGANEPGNWNAYNDPALLAMLPAAALLFRRGDVKEAENTFVLELNPETLMNRRSDPKTSRAIRTIVERSKLRIAVPAMKELPWLKPTTMPEGAQSIKDPDFDAIGPDATTVCSDTGEICRDWQAGVFTINTAKSQIAGGWLGGRKIALKDVTFSITTPNATIAVQSLDEAPISRTSRILISMSAQNLPASASSLPFYSEPVLGDLNINARPGLNLFRIDGEGVKHKVPLKFQDGHYILRLSEKSQSNWWMLK